MRPRADRADYIDPEEQVRRAAACQALQQLSPPCLFPGAPQEPDARSRLRRFDKVRYCCRWNGGGR